jgi:Fe-Mn family superoxide dismutase
MDKRSFLKSTALIGAAALVMPQTLIKSEAMAGAPTPPPFKLPVLPYGYDAFVNVIDKETMEIHYTGHHQAYVDKLNAAVINTAAAKVKLEDYFKNIASYKEPVRNNAGGHWNHSFFWETLTPNKTSLYGGLNDAIKKKYANVDMLKAEFTKAALGQFGSGWAWLIVDAQKQLAITSTPNQDNPLMDLPGIVRGTPIIGLDVWEHAYYLKYHEKRRDYAINFWDIVNWSKAESRYAEAMSGGSKK